MLKNKFSSDKFVIVQNAALSGNDSVQQSKANNSIPLTFSTIKWQVSHSQRLDHTIEKKSQQKLDGKRTNLINNSDRKGQRGLCQWELKGLFSGSVIPDCGWISDGFQHTSVIEEMPRANSDIPGRNFRTHLGPRMNNPTSSILQVSLWYNIITQFLFLFGGMSCCYFWIDYRLVAFSFHFLVRSSVLIKLIEAIIEDGQRQWRRHDVGLLLSFHDLCTIFSSWAMTRPQPFLSIINPALIVCLFIIYHEEECQP